MEDDLLRYITGEEIHASDRVQHNGVYANVVFVSSGTTEEYAPGYEDYIGSERGVVICDDDGQITVLGEPDDLLSFVDRG